VIYQPLIRARLGILDLDWFKREVRYCQMPNGVVQDRVRQVGGRYKDSTDLDFMMRMGIWTENLSLPVVLNECLLQSYSGTLRVFPNTTNLGPARFRNLRAAGAFLVTAAWDGKVVSPVEILSERGASARIVNPWNTARIRVTRLENQRSIPVRGTEKAVEFDTEAGARYRIEAAG
jgi:alpha-L-fucosidase 2